MKRASATFCRLATLGLTIVALLAAFTSAAFAQGAGGTITGTLTDPKGLVVSGGAVIIKNTETALVRTLKTNEAGIYVATFLQPGHYDVTASKEGFASVLRQNLLLNIGQTLTLDFSLHIATTQETVTVTGEAPLLEPDRTAQSQVITTELTQNLPLSNRRWNDIALGTPGATSDGTSGLVSFRGISGLYNQNSVDGANNNQAFFSESRGRAIGIPVVYSADSIQEFQVSTSNYSAEFGQAAGGFINAVTKSGANQTHGDAFYYLRYPTLNALDPFSKAQALTAHKTPTQPVHQQQQFGGSLGGPIVKDKLFYFLTYDGFRKVFPIAYTSTQTFPLPCPVQASAAQCTAANGYFSSLVGNFPRTTVNDVFFGKLDYQLTQKNRLSAAFDLANWKSPNSYNAAYTANNSSVTTNGAAISHDRFLVARWDSTLTPNSTNEVRFQWGRDLETATSNAPGPSVSVLNVMGYGQPNALPRPAFPDEHRIQISDVASVVKGRHTLKFGGDVNLIHDVLANLYNGGGIYSYSNTTPLAATGAKCQTPAAVITFCYWVADTFGLNLGDGKTGKHWTTFAQVNDPITHIGKDDFWNNNYDLFVEDSWKVRSNLTLNLGLRWDIQTVPQPAIPNTNTALLAAYTTKINIDKKDFAPRIGLAWQPFKNTIVRAGYGIFYGLTSNSTYYAIRVENGVFQTQYNCLPGQSCAAPFPDVFFTPPGPPIGAAFAGALPTQVCTPSIPGCPAAGALGLSPIAVHGLDPHFIAPRVHEGDLSIERQLPGNMSISGTWLFSRGLRLPVFVDANISNTTGVTTRSYDVLNSAGATALSFTSPFYTQRVLGKDLILNGESVLNSWYHALVLTFRKPMSHSVELLVNYTFSKTIDSGEVPGQFGTFYGTDTPVDPYNLRAENGLSDLDQRHRFSASAVWSPRYFKSSPSRFVRGALNDWTLATIITAATGQPLTPFLSSFTPVGGVDGGITGAEVSNAGINIGGRAAWLGRNSQPGPGLFDMDFRIGRNVPLYRERVQLQLRAEAFNLLNHTNILGKNTTAYNYVSAGSGVCAGHANPCFSPSPSYLQTTSTSGSIIGARQMQFSARIQF